MTPSRALPTTPPAPAPARAQAVALALAPALALALAQGLPAAAQTAPGSPAGNPRIGPMIAEFVYGAYCAEEPEREDPAPGTASGTINIVPGIPDFRFRTKIVPAEIGIGFGVLAQTVPGLVLEGVTVTVTHPPYPDSGIAVETWETTIDDLGPNLMGFSFDGPHELLPGEWTFAAHDAGGVEIFHMSFEVVAPAFMPQVISACLGTFVS